ncbi:MAG TPA: zf-HC2 domain-containing protein [Ktedonobacterales bacterium]|nr:zf-HC2 domain-containing protein [Ktedonobacterales bacterium]
MTCEELITYLSSYIDDELDQELSREAQEHLATCQNCQIVLNTTQRTILLGRGQARRTFPADRRSPLFARLQEAFLRQPPR